MSCLQVLTAVSPHPKPEITLSQKLMAATTIQGHGGCLLTQAGLRKGRTVYSLGAYQHPWQTCPHLKAWKIEPGI